MDKRNPPLGHGGGPGLLTAEYLIEESGVSSNREAHGMAWFEAQLETAHLGRAVDALLPILLAG